MRLDKYKAYKLRTQGRSYGEIQKLLGVPKATLSAWFSHLELSDTAKLRLKNKAKATSIQALVKRNISQTHLAEERARTIREKANKEVAKLSKKDLFLIGVSLYWAEGYKRPKMYKGKIRTSHAVSLTNSDPHLVKTFVRFLGEVCQVPEERISANLRMYRHQNESYLIEFWNKITHISPSKFSAYYYGNSASTLGEKPLNILPYGTIQIRVNSTELYHRIMGWIDGVSNIN